MALYRTNVARPDKIQLTQKVMELSKWANKFDLDFGSGNIEKRRDIKCVMLHFHVMLSRAIMGCVQDYTTDYPECVRVQFLYGAQWESIISVLNTWMLWRTPSSFWNVEYGIDV